MAVLVGNILVGKVVDLRPICLCFCFLSCIAQLNVVVCY